jgi:hypothetical protein
MRAHRVLGALPAARLIKGKGTGDHRHNNCGLLVHCTTRGARRAGMGYGVVALSASAWTEARCGAAQPGVRRWQVRAMRGVAEQCEKAALLERSLLGDSWSGQQGAAWPALSSGSHGGAGGGDWGNRGAG